MGRADRRFIAGTAAGARPEAVASSIIGVRLSHEQSEVHPRRPVNAGDRLCRKQLSTEY